MEKYFQKKIKSGCKMEQDNKKMGGRSFVITCGVIGTLYSLVYWD
jgi:hypothetical protein